jgi:hypothetical protein
MGELGVVWVVRPSAVGGVSGGFENLRGYSWRSVTQCDVVLGNKAR